MNHERLSESARRCLEAAELEATGYIKNMEEDIEGLRAVPEINLSKAMLGYLIGQLGGDLIGRLATLRCFTAPSATQADVEAMKRTFLATRLVCFHVLSAYEDVLTPKIVEFLADIFERNNDFYQELLTSDQTTEQLVFHSGTIYDDIHLIYQRLEDFDAPPDCVKLALSALGLITLKTAT